MLKNIQTSPTTTTTITMNATNNNNNGSMSSVGNFNSKMSADDKKDRFANNYKKSQISQSTGNLNNRINLSLLSDLQFNDSQFFEVMYVGKIKVSHRNVPKTFIDDAIPKFIAHDKQKLKNLETSQMNDDINGSTEDQSNKHSNGVLRSDSIEVPKRNRAGSINCIDQNRTMVFILSKHEIRLISTDRKQVLLHKKLSDIANIIQGVENTEHFGIICTETKDSKCEYIGYVFKCQSDGITSDIIFSVNKTLETKRTENVENSDNVQCDHCPMVWYKRLETLANGLDERKTQKMILKFIEDLNEEDQEIIMQKYSGSDKVDDFSLHERNKFLMALVEAHCQHRQRRHVHDTLENRSEFLQHYLGGSTIFLKAKRSLAAFDHLLKRRGSSSLVDSNNNPQMTRLKPVRSMSLDPTSTQALTTLKNKSHELHHVNTSKMEMFMKVGNKPKVSVEGSWRQNLMKNSNGVDDSFLLRKFNESNDGCRKSKRNPKELRDLWKFAGRQIILLMRMERENVLLQERQNEHEIRRLKLNYDEILPCEAELFDVWENYINQAKCQPPDNKMFLHAIKRGVPKQKRGEVWLLLAESYRKNHAIVIDKSEFPLLQVPYQDLLRNLTEHQHAIFIDIGRTFPRHEFYKSPFGMGQLSLFNLLKAYSIVDPEMGYCQGLAFICGVLLLHLREEEAFQLLKHLMFERQMRVNFLPDMKHFQMQLYQLSRLIKDNIPEIDEMFEKHEVSTTLYASSWMLTIFSSCFELGFVAKVYDLLFYASNEVIFRVVLSLLIVHKNDILQLDNFDEITEYLKHSIPKINAEKMTKVFENVFSMNITRQLMDYIIEYNVLSDEIQNTQYHIENLKIAQLENKSLQKQVEIAEAGVERLENIRHSQQQEISSLHNQLQDQEVTIQTLSSFVNSLAAGRPDIDIPSDIRRLIRQLDYQKPSQQTANRRPKSIKMSNGGNGLNVLMEQNEIDQILPTPTSSDENSPSPRPKFFSKAFEQIRQHELHRNLSLPTLPDAIISTDKPKLVKQKSSTDDEDIDNSTSDHPLSCDDINFKMKSIELKTIRPTNSFRRK